MIDEPRDHRVTIRTTVTVGGDINRTVRVETFDLTATQYERWPDNNSRLAESALARHAARHPKRGSKPANREVQP